jgi:heparanase 1
MQAVRSVSASVEVWAGEVGPHNGGTNTGGQVPNCAGNRVCGRFGSTLWYADSMSLKAKAGYAAYCRQDFVGADYALLNYTSLSPSPDYYLLLLWKRLLGTRVLSVQQPAAPTTRAYAFCAAPGAAQSFAGANASVAALVLVNLQQNSPACYAAPAAAAQGAAMAVYALTPGAGGAESAHALLNGHLLELDAGGRLPQLPASIVPASAGITLPPMSVSIVLLPLQDASACA